MNIKEITKNIRREITDAFRGIDSNPEHIVNFPAHLAGCSRTKPLKISEDLKPLPSSWGGAHFTVEKITISCTSCGGSQTVRIN